MTDKEIVEKIFSKEYIELLETQEKDGGIGGDPYEELQLAHGFRSFLILPGDSSIFIILDECYEKRLRRDGSVVIITRDPSSEKVKKFVCNDKTGIVYVPAWNGEQHFRDWDDYFKKEEED